MPTLLAELHALHLGTRFAVDELLHAVHLPTFVERVARLLARLCPCGDH